jgi:hypothetical protein
MAWMIFTGSVLLSSGMVYNIFLMVGILPPFFAPVKPYFAILGAFSKKISWSAVKILQ